jgi:50S ribosomal protein L16 3-hydroxylase
MFGAIGVERFLRDYWRRRPLLVRAAFAPLTGVPDRARLFGLAQRDDVEARLVTRFGGRWQLEGAPLIELPRRKRDWTLLVQGMNLYDASLDALMRRFAFLPATRLDDLMVSYAVPGGGVGAHFDSYDVFLIQAHGRREWRISTRGDLALVPGLPLKILDHFVPDQTWVLEPGDMLYLPPHVAHDGVAIDECVTYSVGFRAPTYSELGREFLLDFADRLELKGRFEDATREVVARPAELDDALLDALCARLATLRWRASDVTEFAGRYFTEPKAHVFFTPRPRITEKRLATRIGQHGLRLATRTQMLYRGSRLFINGESTSVASQARSGLRRLADRRCLTPQDCGKFALVPQTLQLLLQWFEAGWIEIGDSHE